jgi:serine protease Do
MQAFRKPSWIAGAALLAVGAVLGAWITVKTGAFPFHYTPVPAAAQDIAGAINFKDGFGPIVKKVQPAVVSVYSTQNVRVLRSSQNLPDSLREFFGDNFGPFNFNLEPQDRTRRGLGSGVIIRQDGYILTNNHVVDDANSVRVALQDGREFDAKIIGTDPQTDLAVLKIDATGLPVADLGDSSKVEVGHVVLAMGNPFGVGQTVTMGIVGATQRRGLRIEDYEDFIQTDAAINPGNSGGALVNMNGQVIGINTAIISGGPSVLGGGGGNQGVGFAIPINMAKNVMQQIIDHGKVTRGWLGVMIQPVTPDIAQQFNLSGEPRGSLIGDVTAGSPAERAGLKRGDIILGLNGTEIKDRDELRLRIASMAPGSTANLRVFRDGREQQIAVTLGELPAQTARSRGSSSGEGGGPQLGVEVSPVTPQLSRQYNLGGGVNGLVITNVSPGSAAAEAGLRPGDVIVEVNRLAVRDVTQFRQMVRGANGSLLLLIHREGSTMYVTVRPR